MRYFRIASTVVVSFSAVLLTCSGQQPAQQNLPKNELTVPNVSGVFIAPIPGASFSGTLEVTAEQKLSDGSVNVLKTVNLIARDSQGRTYNERRRFVASAYADEPPLQTFHIYDPITGLNTNLDPYTLVARQTVMSDPPKPRGDAVPVADPAASTPPVKSEDLGTQTFEGLLLKGVRQSQGAEVVNEFWYSPDLSIYVIRKHADAKWKLTLTVTHIDRNEPDPSKFVVPDSYKVIDGATMPTQIPGQPGVYAVGGGVSAPQVIHSVNPQFTDEARRAKFGGICVVGLVVDASGMPQNVHVVKPLGKGLDQKAIEAVQKYRFKPAMYEGHAVPVEVDIEVEFKIY